MALGKGTIVEAVRAASCDLAISRDWSVAGVGAALATVRGAGDWASPVVYASRGGGTVTALARGASLRLGVAAAVPIMDGTATVVVDAYLRAIDANAAWMVRRAADNMLVMLLD